MPAVNFTLLRDKRDELDFSNPELAAKVEVSKKYMENVLCGTNQPSMRLVYRFARVLGLDVEDILAEQPQPTGDPSDPPTQPSGPKGPPRRQDAETTKKGPKRASDKAVA